MPRRIVSSCYRVSSHRFLPTNRRIPPRLFLNPLDYRGEHVFFCLIFLACSTRVPELTNRRGLFGPPGAVLDSRFPFRRWPTCGHSAPRTLRERYIIKATILFRYAQRRCLSRETRMRIACRMTYERHSVSTYFVTLRGYICVYVVHRKVNVPRREGS